MSETDPIEFFPAMRQASPKAGSKSPPVASKNRHAAPRSMTAQPVATPGVITFTRFELNDILSLYGRHVAAGDWRDYAIDLERDHAVFSVFRHASEMPFYRIEKWPALARKQGMFKVVALSGQILRRGHELKKVLRVLEPKQKLSTV